MKQLFILSTVFFISTHAIFSQSYSPQVGSEGCDAIHQDSSIIKAWAKTCSVVRGPIKISEPDSLANFGEPENAIGARTEDATFNVVSLGDGGSATLTFHKTIINGTGPDFAVFENGFILSGSEHLAFLELAFVEVSSDGKTFVRFAAVNEYTEPQLGGFAAMDARYLHNLAGKHIAKYGTPFDLEELKDSAGIDINHITHVRIIDVVGNISPEYATYDSKGNPVNDPWPTPFWTGGFDLGGVAVIHEGVPYNPNSSINELQEYNFLINAYPNPTKNTLTIYSPQQSNFTINDPLGKIVISGSFIYGENILSLDNLSSGIYFIHTENTSQTVKFQINN